MQTYFAKLRREILHLIPKDAKRILDVGCGNGVTAEYIKKNNFSEKVDGIELDPGAFKEAQSKLDMVYNIDLNGKSSPFGEIASKYDCILFLDVLEHLTDPYNILLSCKTILNDSGCIVISLPNIRHYTVLIPLIFKNNWTYTDEGILDKTHLRFFTSKSAAKLIESAGFKITESSRNISYYRGFKILNIILLGILTPFSVSQLIFKCVKN